MLDLLAGWQVGSEPRSSVVVAAAAVVEEAASMAMLVVMTMGTLSALPVRGGTVAEKMDGDGWTYLINDAWLHGLVKSRILL